MKDDFKKIEQLIKRLKLQDQSVFPELYELSYPRIYFLCYSILRNEEDAKDAVQETYMKILANISLLQDDRLFTAWANKIAYNICIRMFSKNKAVLLKDEFINSFSDENQNNKPYAALERSEKAKVLSALIDGLDPVLRSTLIFKYFDDLRIKQISEIMDCPEGTVKSRLNTAKRLLKAAIEKERKGDSLLSAFICLPLRQALAYSASRSAMDPEVASIIFENILSQNGMSRSLVFTPQPCPGPTPHSYARMATVGGTVVGTSAVILLAVMNLTPPVISRIEAHQPGSGFTNSAVPITANIKAPLKSIVEAYLISDDGRRIDGYIDQGKNARFCVKKNGIYTLHVVASNALEAAAEVAVTAIDDKAPSVLRFTYTRTELILELDDMYSGIDFTTIEGVTTSGRKVYPVSYDDVQKTVAFDFPKENFRLSIRDRSGNVSYHMVDRIEY